ncbi:MAG TPA: SBBP repeat-containing protein [Stenomitos sp.]
MRNLPRCNQSWISAVSVSLALIVMVPLANIAVTPEREALPPSKIDLLHRLEQPGNSRRPKGKLAENDAWVAKFQVGTDGVIKMLWKRQLGSPSSDASRGIATDRNGNVLITGYTRGALGGTSQGYFDAWVAKYSRNGSLLWSQQLGTSSFDLSNDVATDRDGNVFITGFTGNALAGIYKGGSDAWVAKYSPDGTLAWTRQLGTTSVDESYSIATDSKGNVIISGSTYGTVGGSGKGGSDAWVAKYSPDGTLAWTRQFGSSSSDYSYGVAIDSNDNVFITGTTSGALVGANQGLDDAWVAKYSPNGTLKWMRQLGSSSSDNSYAVATDSSGNVFMSGLTAGPLGSTHKGKGDAWVAKYSPTGALMWTKQLGSSSSDYSKGVATNSSGNVFIAGATSGALGGINQGLYDAWVAQFSPHGKQLWVRQDRTPQIDVATEVAVDSNDDVLTTGYTDGNFAGD